MAKYKININFDVFTLSHAFITNTIRKCVEATLSAEKLDIPCEINVLITNDAGIQSINKASRDIDKPTDVLSFPMFQLTPGVLPADWEEYLDPETGMCPLGDM